MLYLFTENLFLSARAKNIIKILLNRQDRGPKAVYKSLVAGLRELNENFTVNEKLSEPIETACVLSGAKVVAWAVNQKRKGRINKIVAGPNIVISPKDANGILENPLIDKIIAPSQWVKDFYIKTSPNLLNKIFIWPAGVSLPAEKKCEKIFDFLIYNKIKNNDLYKKITDELKAKGYKIRTLEYGKFKQTDYFKLLEQSNFLIYLSESESQGLAMFEAWARGVPILVWERGFWKTLSNEWMGMTASPYVSEENGMRFKNFEEFKTILLDFMSGSYNPRKFIQDNFNNKISAKKYLNIVNNA